MTDKDKKLTVTGMKVVKYDVRRAKDAEKLRLVLEADVDEITADMGKVQKALLVHRTSDNDVGLNLLIKEVTTVTASDDDDVNFE